MCSDFSGWEVCKTSVRGASHRRSGAPNQDACAELRTGSCSVVAVADGHGSPKSFRSDRGARMAVEVAIGLVGEFLRGNGSAPLHQIRENCESGLPGEFVRGWGQRVNADLAEHPFSSEEREKLVGGSGEGAWDAVEKNPRLAYGATLLVAAISPKFAAFWQLGDGDILTVSQDGKSVIRPIVEDPTLIANETTSLCLDRASRHFRTAFFSAESSEMPTFVMLSTDGYANSYSTPQAFEQVAVDLFAMIQEKGFETICDKLEGWLTEASEEGSGDDVTVGLLWKRCVPCAKPETEKEIFPEERDASLRGEQLEGTSGSPANEPTLVSGVMPEKTVSVGVIEIAKETVVESIPEGDPELASEPASKTENLQGSSAPSDDSHKTILQPDSSNG